MTIYCGASSSSAVTKLFVTLFAFVSVMTGCITEKDYPQHALDVGDELPPFSITMNDGSRINSADLAGTVSVIVFFNTSCNDCRKELPIVQAVYGKYSSSQADVRFLCIARDEDAESIETYWTVNELNLPYSPQHGREVYSLFASEGIPRIYVISPHLKISAAFSDMDMPSEMELSAAIDALLSPDKL